MAYKFQLGTAVMSGALSQQGAFEVQSDINESTLYKIERTAGNVSGSGTLYHAGATTFSSTVAATGSVTAGTSFIIGSADLNEVDMEKLDGITNGTGAANKALVLDGSRDVDTINALGIASMANNWTNAGRTVADGGIFTTLDLNGGNIDGTIIGASSVAAGSFAAVVGTSANFSTTLNADGATTLNGAVTLGNATADDLTFTGLVASDIVPKTDSTSDLGTSALQWANVHADAGNIDSIIATSVVATSMTTATLSGSGNTQLVGTLTSIGAIASSGSITAGTSFIIGSADLNEVDMEKLDGITNGAGAANKCLVLDGSKDVNTINALGIASMANNWTNASRTVADMGVVTTMDLNGGSIDGTVIGAAAQAAASFTTLSGSGALSLVGAATVIGSLSTSGSVKLAGVAAAAVAVASDSLYFLDGDGLMKSESFVDYATSLAGDGLSASGGVLALDMNELTEAAVNVASDSLIFIDADGNVTRKDTWVDYATAIAGAGITATNGVLSTDAAVSSTGIGDANATLAEGFNYGTTTLSADRTWTLPAAPSTNDIVRVKAPAALGGNELIVAVNGGTSHLIDGNGTVVVDSAGGALTMQYVGADTWLIY
jgi:hypothetical protein|tara:strand:+ start:2502 stop:4316 length:1815 start_codon:yes stop_codon:yes gene_type:complete